MGLEAAIHDILESQWAHQAFHPVQTGYDKLGQDFVRVEDCLTRCRSSQPMPTCKEFYDFLMVPTKLAFLSGRVHFSILTFDDEANKTKRKLQTMLKRMKQQEQAKKEQQEPLFPYPDDIRVEDQGVVDAATGEVLPFHFSRFCRNKKRHLKLLYLYLEEKMKHDPDIDKEHVVIHEYCSTGPTVIPSWPSALKEPDSLLHDHSEGDPSSVFWSQLLCRSIPVAVYTTDTDVIAIFAFLVASLTQEEREKTKILWFNSRDKAVDVVQMILQACRSLCITPELFALGCILCQTDYNQEKHSYAHGFGELHLFYALKELNSFMDPLLQYGKEYVEPDPEAFVVPLDSDEHVDFSYAEVRQEAEVAFDAFCRFLHRGIPSRKEVREEMQALKPYEMPCDTMKMKKPGSNKRKLVEIQDVPTWDNIRNLKRLSSSKSAATLPAVATSQETLRYVLDGILWNYHFWQRAIVTKD